MKIETQIGGKYHSDNTLLFDLKRNLVAQGVSVRHPILDKISKQINDTGFAFNLGADWQSFFEVETDYYNCLRASNLHIISNDFTWMGITGYVGGNASLEFCFCAAMRRPVVFTQTPNFSSGLDIFTKTVCTKNIRFANIISSELLSSDFHSIYKDLDRSKDYDISIIEILRVMEMVKTTLDCAQEQY